MRLEGTISRACAHTRKDMASDEKRPFTSAAHKKEKNTNRSEHFGKLLVPRK